MIKLKGKLLAGFLASVTAVSSALAGFGLELHFKELDKYKEEVKKLLSEKNLSQKTPRQIYDEKLKVSKLECEELDEVSKQIDDALKALKKTVVPTNHEHKILRQIEQTYKLANELIKVRGQSQSIYGNYNFDSEAILENYSMSLFAYDGLREASRNISFIPTDSIAGSKKLSKAVSSEITKALSIFDKILQISTMPINAIEIDPEVRPNFKWDLEKPPELHKA